MTDTFAREVHALAERLGLPDVVAMLTVECGWCNGTGVSVTAGRETCRDCHGTGRVFAPWWEGLPEGALEGAIEHMAAKSHGIWIVEYTNQQEDMPSCVEGDTRALRALRAALKAMEEKHE